MILFIVSVFLFLFIFWRIIFGFEVKSVKILENEDYNLHLNINCTEEPLVLFMREYCLKKKCRCYIVSLSGGVDSMVIASILHMLKFEVICVHINYNNRPESLAEAKFLQQWCAHNKIRFVLKNIDFAKRGEINRNFYEKKNTSNSI